MYRKSSDTCRSEMQLRGKSVHSWCDGFQINPSWLTHWAISRSSQCSTTGVTKAVLCAILSEGAYKKICRYFPAIVSNCSIDPSLVCRTDTSFWLFYRNVPYIYTTETGFWMFYIHFPSIYSTETIFWLFYSCFTIIYNWNQFLIVLQILPLYIQLKL